MPLNTLRYYKTSPGKSIPPSQIYHHMCSLHWENTHYDAGIPFCGAVSSVTGIWKSFNQQLYSSSVVHWRRGLMASGTGHDHMGILWGLIYNLSFQKHEYSRRVRCSLDIKEVLKREIILCWGTELQLQWLLPRLPLQSQGSNFGPAIFKFDMHSKIIYWTSFCGHGEGRNCGVMPQFSCACRWNRSRMFSLALMPLSTI